jgi:hypothetical protein
MNNLPKVLTTFDKNYDQIIMVFEDGTILKFVSYCDVHGDSQINEEPLTDNEKVKYGIMSADKLSKKIRQEHDDRVRRDMDDRLITSWRNFFKSWP